MAVGRKAPLTSEHVLREPQARGFIRTFDGLRVMLLGSEYFTGHFGPILRHAGAAPSVAGYPW